MDKLKGPKTVGFMALAALAMVFAVSGPSQAMDGRGFGGGQSGGSGMHGGFDARHGFDGRHDFDGRHGFDRFGHRRFGFGQPFFPYYGYYPYGDRSSAYWYYCPSYGAYYPSVASCPEAWVPVPAS